MSNNYVGKMKKKVRGGVTAQKLEKLNEGGEKLGIRVKYDE